MFRSLATRVSVIALVCLCSGCAIPMVEERRVSTDLEDISESSVRKPDGPHVLILGIAQDAGVPQAGTRDHPAWDDPSLRRHASCIAVIDGDKRYLFEATPDFKVQLRRLDRWAPRDDVPGLDGVFLTHAHMGHYTGLVHLGHEVIGAHGTPVYVMEKMGEFLTNNGPWNQLVRYDNIELRALTENTTVELGRVRVTPFLVPHRQEYSEVVGFRIEGPNRSVVFIPDIDSWDDWDTEGTRIEDVLAGVDVALVDGTFYANGEIPGRDMSGFPHPFITTTMNRLAPLPTSERNKVKFLHLNHTNPALWRGTEARREVEARGFSIAGEGEVIAL